MGKHSIKHFFSFLIIVLIILTYLPFSNEVQATTVSTDSFVDSRINWAAWKNLQDCNMTEGELLYLNFSITGISSYETLLEVYLDSPASPNRQIDTISYTDLQALDTNGSVLSCGYYVDIASGDQEGMIQFKFYVIGNLLGWVEVTGGQYYYENTFASGSINVSDFDKLSGSVSLEWTFSDTDGDTLYYSLYYQEFSWTYTYKDFSSFLTLYNGYGSTLLFNSTDYNDQQGTLALRVWEQVNGEWWITKVYYLLIYIDNINNAPVLDTPTINQYSDYIEIWYSATDFNGDSILYSIFYATDGINFVNTLVAESTNTYYNWDIADLPSGDNYTLQIIAEDEHGLTDSFTSTFYSITGDEYIEILKPTESVTITSTIEVTVSKNFEGSVELFVNEHSYGTQTSEFTWDVTLVSGPNTLIAIGTNNIGTEFEAKHVINLVDIVVEGQPSDAESSDGDIILWPISASIEETLSLDFEFSVVANLSHSPIFNINPGDSLLLTHKIALGNCTVTLTIEDLSVLLETLLEPILGDAFPIDEPGIYIDYDTISNLFEGEYPLDLDLRIGSNTIPILITVPIIDWTFTLTIDIDIVLYVQFGVIGNAEIADPGYLPYNSYKSQTLGLNILEAAEKGDQIFLTSAYGVTIDNVAFTFSVVGDEFFLFGNQLLPSIDESERVFDSGQLPIIWVSQNNLYNLIVVGKSKSAPGFDILMILPIMTLIVLYYKKKRKFLS